ncbi:MAG: hypothetical protein O2958_14920 [Gemmatimonadetes bacterium]|nr:hypothetical protein [Gemmatimonadota bacterium]MDA1104413.1 hypothetical protein [Gemmatimonadota bacterium]
MTAPDLIGLFIEPLEGTGIPYMITGGVASVIYGDPRFTRDVDVVLELRPANIPRLESVFQGGDYYLPPLENLQEEATRSPAGHFNIIHRDTALRADIYLAGDDPLHQWAFQHRRRMRIEAIEIWVAPIEYVVLRKLQYYQASQSDRHLRDIAMMLRISGDLIDISEMDRWLIELELVDVFRQAQAYEPS